MEEADITIIGAGVMGLAIAAELAGKYGTIVVLEKNDGFGQETSSRNSEVIHSGIYYATGSLKAKLCVEGARMLYEICNKYKIPHRRIGKVIIATDKAEAKRLAEVIFEKGKKNNVSRLMFLEKEQVAKIEPSTNAVAAIYSPDTGIIDSHALMKYFYYFAKENGVLLAFCHEAEALKKEKDGFIINIKGLSQLKSRIVINCAGLNADYLASLAGVDIRENGYKLKFCKGTYFSYTKPSPVKILVYPLPQEELTGLGVHATLGLNNKLRFGPDVEYVDAIEYSVNINKRSLFYEGASKIIPGLEKEAFIPDQAGVRPKLYGPHEPVRDFVISEESNKGLSGLINLIGIESPGLTASPAIAKMVENMVSGLLN